MQALEWMVRSLAAHAPTALAPLAIAALCMVALHLMGASETPSPLLERLLRWGLLALALAFGGVSLVTFVVEAGIASVAWMPWVGLDRSP